LWNTGDPYPWDEGVAAPKICLLCYRAKFGHYIKPYKSNNGDPPEIFDPSCPAVIKITQGHWNWHGLIGYL